jgi:predicted RNase H-like nuclease (RuvC/YqgF family)
MLRRYAQALETVTGISLQVDPVRGRLYPVATVELLENARAYLLAHPGGSVEAALRAVTGQGAGEVGPPARVPGTLGAEELRAALAGMLGELQAPVLEMLSELANKNEKLSSELSATRSEVQALREQLRQLPAPPELTPVLDAQAGQRGEVAALRSQVDALGGELAAARSTVERLEVMTRAALGGEPSRERGPSGLRAMLARWLGGR